MDGKVDVKGLNRKKITYTCIYQKIILRVGRHVLSRSTNNEQDFEKAKNGNLSDKDCQSVEKK